MISRLERSDEEKSTIADYAPGKLPGNGSKKVAELKVALSAANLSTKGVKKDLVARLDNHHARIANASAVGDHNVVVGANDGAGDALPECNEQDRDEIDELADIAIDRAQEDVEEDDPDLDPEGYDGVDQEELLD